ncbi:MAG: cupin domain-containing protein [Epulopiscium sp.]|nr:cupin domain-containing protein [Candidatus Epulonipiscium sp.]
MYRDYKRYPYTHQISQMISQRDTRYQNNQPYSDTSYHNIQLQDYGPKPFVIDIEDATMQNNNFRTALWTGTYIQLTLMSINVGDEIGLEMHPDIDQFIRIEEGEGMVMMGDFEDNLDFQMRVDDDYIIIIPAGKWHNLINIGNQPIKLYSIYAPPQHPHGTVHETKFDAEAAEADYGY